MSMPYETPDEAIIQKGLAIAKSANERAYAPYSNFPVSAALYLRDRDEIIPGVNVENASFGGTICAERSAFVSAISRDGSVDPGFIIVYTRQETLTPPCGICLQFMNEFVEGDFPVYLFNQNGQRRNLVFDDLLPVRFKNF
jgi:cytidine deaminase